MRGFPSAVLVAIDAGVDAGATGGAVDGHLRGDVAVFSFAAAGGCVFAGGDVQVAGVEADSVAGQQLAALNVGFSAGWDSEDVVSVTAGR